MKKLEASTSSVDFGEVVKGTKVERTVTLTNESSETLRLTPWRSCGCTDPVLGTNSLESSKSTTLRIIFDTTGKSGYQEKSVGVNYYLDGKPYSLKIIFTAKIKK